MAAKHALPLNERLNMATRPIYASSKLKHREHWLASGFTMTSTWIHSKDLPPDECSAMWDRYRDEIEQAEGFVLYAEADDMLKGCMLELGVAFSCRLPVIIIWSGNYSDLAKKIGTIIYHESVQVVANMVDAETVMKLDCPR
tara:strand:- start:3671 stop:4096 length:426 start_codon:yes stop_codon:yes gene_type:complete